MGFLHYVRLIRPLNCVMATFAVYIGYCVSIGEIGFEFLTAYAMVSAFLICGAGQAINDYFDREIDMDKAPDKPIPSGKVKPKSALNFSLLLFFVGLVFAWSINREAATIAIAFTALLIVYAAYLGNYKYLGNWVVAAGTAFTLVFGASVTQNYFPAVYLALAALFANVPREITKDFEDLEADRGNKVSLPMILPHIWPKVLILALYLAGIGTGLGLYFLGIYGNAWYLWPISGASLGFLASACLAFTGSYKLSQQLSKIGMLLALLAFLAGVAL